MSCKLNFEERTILKELLKDLWDYYGNSSNDDLDLAKLFPDITMRHSVMRELGNTDPDDATSNYTSVSKGRLLELLLPLI